MSALAEKIAREIHVHLCGYPCEDDCRQLQNEAADVDRILSEQWQPINTAPKDGTLILCWADGWEAPALLRWKTNPRIAAAYFGDPAENDDYDLAEPDGAPTLWLPIPDPTTSRKHEAIIESGAAK